MLNLQVTCAAACVQGKTDKVEPWYGTEYSQDGVVSDWLSNWLKAFPNGCIHLPEPNPFISSEFSLIKVSLLPAGSSTQPMCSALLSCK